MASDGSCLYILLLLLEVNHLLLLGRYGGTELGLTALGLALGCTAVDLGIELERALPQGCRELRLGVGESE